MAKSKSNKSQVKEKNTEVVEKKESTLYYFYSVGCGFCKKAEPIVDELIKEGHDILKLDLADPDNQALNNELKQEYNVQCGTPWFVNEATGKGICGFREKDVLEKWLAGEDIPVPPRPKGPIPKLPLLNAPEKEIKKWKAEYKKWLKENDHLPDKQKRSVEDMLDQPRPKTEPPKPPNPSMTDEQLDEWGKEYEKWKNENEHLPNLQPTQVILGRLKQQKSAMEQQQANQPSQNTGTAMSPDQNARLQRLEQKVDKLIKHLGVK